MNLRHNNIVILYMSYKNVFYGTIGPLTFNSRRGDVLDGSEMRRYLPEDFLIHPFTKLKLGYQLKYHIQVYNDKNFGIGRKNSLAWKLPEDLKST